MKLDLFVPVGEHTQKIVKQACLHFYLENIKYQLNYFRVFSLRNVSRESVAL